jgi:hypothetical protein
MCGAAAILLGAADTMTARYSHVCNLSVGFSGGIRLASGIFQREALFVHGEHEAGQRHFRH